MAAENNLNARYLAGELVCDPEAKIHHFKPLENGRDEFGNRIFTSPLSYIDKEGQSVKAALLVSPLGENFIRGNSGVLKDIERGMNRFVEIIKSKTPEDLKKEKPKIEISHGGTLSYLSTGGQSHAFLLEVNDKKYIIKTNATMTAKYPEVGQPYINEMLQTQTLDNELGSRLKDLDIRVSHFLFSSAYMSCREYEEGEWHPKMDDRDKNKVFNRMLSSFLNTKRYNNDPLWKNIYLDLEPFDVDAPEKNMVKVHDGYVWIDPFYHYKK